MNAGYHLHPGYGTPQNDGYATPSPPVTSYPTWWRTWWQWSQKEVVVDMVVVVAEGGGGRRGGELTTTAGGAAATVAEVSALRAQQQPPPHSLLLTFHLQFTATPSTPPPSPATALVKLSCYHDSLRDLDVLDSPSYRFESYRDIMGSLCFSLSSTWGHLLGIGTTASKSR
ncbi:hypothetical protein Droror1_Dr00010244 [Drosera rotundifolia]